MWKRFLEYCLPLLIALASTVGVLGSTEVFSQDFIMDEEQLEMPEDFRSTIIIAHDKDLAPLSYESDGEIRGILVDITNLILAERLEKQVEHRGYSWKRAQFMVSTENADAFCAEPEAARKRYTYFTSSPLIITPQAIFSGISNPRRSGIEAIGGVEGVQAFSVVDYLGSPRSRDTFSKDIRDRIHWVGSLDTVFKMLAINRYDIYIGDSIIGRYTLTNLGLADDVLVRPVTIGEQIKYHFGIRKTHPDAQAIIKDAQRVLAQIRNEGLIERIVQGYINPQEVESPSQ